MIYDDLLKEFKKLQFQVSLLSQAVDPVKNPLEDLILSMDWTERHVERMHEIFENADSSVRQGGDDFEAFENKLVALVGGDLSRAHDLVRAVYLDRMWLYVCRKYAQSLAVKPLALACIR